MSISSSDSHGDALRSFGRRHGKKLRANHQRLIDDVLPTLRISPDSSPDNVHPDPSRPCWLEVGFGGGEHLATQAARHPEIDFIGCEPFVNGIAKLLAEIQRTHLKNIRIVDDDARLVFPLLPQASLERAFVLFPDPWPKLRHHKRRLIQPAFIDALARLLKDGGEFRFASDHMDYVRWTLAMMHDHPLFEWLAEGPSDWRTPPPDWVATRYEQKALERGERCVYLRFRRVKRG